MRCPLRCPIGHHTDGTRCPALALANDADADADADVTVVRQVPRHRTAAATARPTQPCARRAGHTIAVLFRVYAKVLAHTQDQANRRIDAALREWNEPD